MTHSAQGTIKQPIAFEGKGLHTGKFSKITINPAPVDTGIVFRRIDKKGKNTEILAHWKNTTDLPLCTTIIAPNGIHVRTIEHLMAAFYACEIDNALIEIKGSEIPILDGSAKPYVDGILEAGITTQDKARKVFVITKKVEIDTGERHIILEPADELFFDITIIIKQLGRMQWNGTITPDFFQKNISQARTFGELRDGLLAQLSRFSNTPVCLGANTKTAVVIGKNKRILNKDGLRMPDEFIKHRMLDLLGDFMLVRGDLQAKITTKGPVHKLTHEIIKKVFEEEAMIEITDKS